MSNQLKIGQNVSVTRINSSGQEVSYSTLIENILDDDTYLMAHPIKRGTYVSFMRGTTLRIVYSMKNVGIFEFGCVVESSYDRKDDTIQIRRTTDIKKTQRRNYYRIDVLLDMKVFTGKDKLDDLPGEMTQLVNISGGGVKFYTSKNLSLNDIIYLNISLDTVAINVQGRVVQIEYLKDPIKGGKNKMVAVEFFDIYEEDRNEIIKFIFAKERELLNKGK